MGIDSWEHIKIGDLLANSYGGGTPVRSNPKYWNGDMPWATVKDFKGDSDLLTYTEESISIEGLKRSAASIVQAGIPVICMRMAVGRIAVFSKEIAINQDLKALETKKEIDSHFFIKLIPSIIHEIEKLSVGTTVKGISSKELLSISVYIPKKVESQRRIAEILDTIDEAIQKTEALIEKLKAIKQGLLHDLLTRGLDENGKLRDPKTHPEQFKGSDFGLMPAAWGSKTIEEIKANTPNALAMGPFGSNITVNNFVDNGIPVIRGINLSNLYINFRDAVYISEKKADELHSSNIVEDDIVITHRGTIGQVSLFNNNSQYKRAVVSQSQLKLTCNKDLMSPLFLTIFLKSDFGQKLISKAKGHTGVQAIGQPLSSIKKMKIPTPPLAEQHLIESMLIDGNDRINKEEVYLNKLTLMKKGLMHDLLTGNVRVKGESQEEEIPL